MNKTGFWWVQIQCYISLRYLTSCCLLNYEGVGVMFFPTNGLMFTCFKLHNCYLVIADCWLTHYLCKVCSNITCKIVEFSQICVCLYLIRINTFFITFLFRMKFNGIQKPCRHPLDPRHLDQLHVFMIMFCCWAR